MGRIYNRAFRTVVRRRRDALSQEERDEASSPNRQGDLSPSAPRPHALYDTYRYQRSHADAFKKALTIAKVKPPRTDHTMAIIDIGAGAATVGVAISEVWSNKVESISYHMIEPNKSMKRLGRRLLSKMETPFAGISSHRSVTKFVATHPALNADRILVTLSYVLHQSNVKDADVRNWVRLIRKLSRLPNRPRVEILATTVSSTDPELQDRDSRAQMQDQLRKVLPAFRMRGNTFRSDHRFPRNDVVNGKYWDRREVDWENVRYVHWYQSKR